MQTKIRFYENGNSWIRKIKTGCASMKKAHWEVQHRISTSLKSKKMWCRNCGRLKEVNATYCVCGKSTWSLRKIL